MPLLQLVIPLIVVGVLLWLVNTYIPMAGSIKSILNVVVIIVVVLWLLGVFGVVNMVVHFPWYQTVDVLKEWHLASVFPG